MEKISAVYKITNTITGDFYIGSSKDIKRRWASHKYQHSWKKQPNSKLYKAFQKYGLDKFSFRILKEVEPEYLKQTEQEYIIRIKPTYNDRYANKFNIERHKKYRKEYNKSERGREAYKRYYHSEKCRETNKKYYHSEKGHETALKQMTKYRNQLCNYKGETLKLHTLATRFHKAGIERPTIEAKKYLINI